MVKRFGLAVLLLATVVPQAQAALPAGPKSIKPGKSIGGVSIGMNGQAARDKWGTGGSCDDALRSTCTYRNAAGAYLSFDLDRNGKVALVSIRVATRSNGNPIFSGAITRWKTSKKIHIGSKVKAVRKAYRKVKGSSSGLALTQGKRVTPFSTSGGRVSEIFIAPKG